MKRFSVVVRVAPHEVGPEHCLGLVPLVDHLQEAAAAHSERIGIGVGRLQQDGLNWIVGRLIMRMARWPRSGELIRLETWAYKRTGHIFQREFQWRDEGGRFFGAASSKWALFDALHRRVAAPPAWMKDIVPWDAEEAVGFEGLTLPPLGEHRWERPVVPRWSDLDFNAHVNNAQLMGWALEGLPRPFRQVSMLREIDVQFRHECRIDDEVRSCAEAEAANLFSHSLVRAADGAELIRARSLWESTQS